MFKLVKAMDGGRFNHQMVLHEFDSFDIAVEVLKALRKDKETSKQQYRLYDKDGKTVLKIS